MSHTTTFRRTASALGATALLGMALAAPAMAAQDPGDGVPAVDATTTSQFPTGLDRERREGNASSVDRERQLGGFTYSKELSTLPQEATTPSPGRPSSSATTTPSRTSRSARACSRASRWPVPLRPSSPAATTAVSRRRDRHPYRTARDRHAVGRAGPWPVRSRGRRAPALPCRYKVA